MRPTVYLAGQITGLTYNRANDWRLTVTRDLADCGIKAISPLRCKEFLAALESISGHGAEYSHMSVLSSPRGVMTRDRFDAMRCNVLFCNLLGTTVPSIGTCMEIAWADSRRTPIVAVMEESGNPHDHMMINEAIGFRVPTIEEGVATVKAILL